MPASKLMLELNQTFDVELPREMLGRESIKSVATQLTKQA